MIFRIFNYFFIVVFLLCAAVQYNDPDPVQWTAVYLAAMILCILFAVGKFPVKGAAALIMIALAWAAFQVYLAIITPGAVTLQSVFGSTAMINERVELVRETGGLLIVAAWSFALIRQAR